MGEPLFLRLLIMWFAILSIIFYVAALLWIVPFLLYGGNASKHKTGLFLTAFAALLCHLISIMPVLENLAEGQSFTLLQIDRKSTRLNSSHNNQSRMPSSA